MNDSEALAEFMALTPAQKASLTKSARRHSTGFRIGDRVRINTPQSLRFHDRMGTVVTTNLGEVGVAFGAPDNVDAWFAPAELNRGASA